MICFPLDDTLYEAEALGAWCGTRTRGVFSGDGHYAVTANGDMTVTVSPGLAWLKADTYWGVNAFEEVAQVLAVDLADGVLPRIDAVCIRLDKNMNRGELVIKQGAYSPQPPAIAPPVRNLDYDEIYVATITVRAGATMIEQSDITDQRLNETYCGLMRDGVTGIPTQDLFNEWRAWLAKFNNDAKKAYDEYKANMTAYEQSAMQEFIEWFALVQATLDEDVAGNLFNLIYNLDYRVNANAANIQWLVNLLTSNVSANPWRKDFDSIDGIELIRGNYDMQSKSLDVSKEIER